MNLLWVKHENLINIEINQDEVRGFRSFFPFTFPFIVILLLILSTLKVDWTLSQFNEWRLEIVGVLWSEVIFYTLDNGDFPHLFLNRVIFFHSSEDSLAWSNSVKNFSFCICISTTLKIPFDPFWKKMVFILNESEKEKKLKLLQPHFIVYQQLPAMKREWKSVHKAFYHLNPAFFQTLSFFFCVHVYGSFGELWKCLSTFNIRVS